MFKFMFSSLIWTAFALLSRDWLFVILWLWPARHFPGRNTGLGCHFLLQEIFLTQCSAVQYRWILYHLTQQGSTGLPWSYTKFPCRSSTLFHWNVNIIFLIIESIEYFSVSVGTASSHCYFVGFSWLILVIHHSKRILYLLISGGKSLVIVLHTYC